jgi:mannosyltransferase
MRTEWRRWLAPLLTGVFATLVTSIAIGVPAPWRDEEATATAASRSWGQLLDLVTGSTDAVHATYYALVKPWVDLVGVDPMWLRLPSAVAVGLAAAGIVVLGTMLDRTATGVIAAIVLVVLPRVFWAGGEARSYALQATAAVWLTVLFVHAVRRGRWWRWVLFAVATAIANWLFLYLALIGVAQLITLALGPGWRRKLLPALAAIAGGAIAALPIVLLGFAQRSQISWVPVPDLGVLGAIAKSQWFMGSNLFSVVGWVLVIGGVIALLVPRERPVRRDLLALLLPWLILPTVALIAISVAVSPIYLDRYLVMSAPAIALLAAFAITRLPPIPAHIAVLLVVVAAIPVAIEQRSPGANGDWGEVAALTAEAARPDEAIYFSTDPFDDDPRGLMTFYPATFGDLDDIAFLESAAEAGTIRDRVAPIADALGELHPDQTLITVFSHDSDAAAADRETLERRGFDEAVIAETGLTTVSRWSRQE